MSMTVEVSLSGLFLLVLKSADPEPEHPDAVDVVFPAAPHHRVLVSYAPQDVVTQDKPAMVVDDLGRRIASREVIGGQVMTLKLDGSSETNNNVVWGKDQKAPANSSEEHWLRWIPKLKDIGLDGFQLGGSGNLPTNAAARLSLPFGTIKAAEVVKEPKANKYVIWKFPAAMNQRRAVANRLVFSARGVEAVNLNFSAGKKLYYKQPGATFRLSVSNDLSFVPLDYSSDDGKLKHLTHLAALDSIKGTFQTPEIDTVQQTGKPICNGTVFVDTGG